MPRFLDHIAPQQDAHGCIEGPVVPPIGARWRLASPFKIATICSPRHIQSVLEDAQSDIEYLAATLQAVLNEVHPHVRGTSADSWLPEPLVVQCLSALGYAPEVPK